MLGVGEPTPPIEATAYDGTSVSLAAYRGRPVVLYFFPRAGTPGCTRETRGFAESLPALSRAGVAVIGVSTDPAERQGRMARDCQAPFPLLPDPGGRIARSFGVLGFLGMARRVTFLIGPDGRVLEVIEGVRPGPHVQGALRRLAPSSAPDEAQPSSGTKPA